MTAGEGGQPVNSWDPFSSERASPKQFDNNSSSEVLQASGVTLSASSMASGATCDQKLNSRDLHLRQFA
ncbi:MAG: hypothetical protein RIQ81_1484 [Pseudomonadota bacterium]